MCKKEVAVAFVWFALSSLENGGVKIAEIDSTICLLSSEVSRSVDKP